MQLETLRALFQGNSEKNFTLVLVFTVIIALLSVWVLMCRRRDQVPIIQPPRTQRKATALPKLSIHATNILNSMSPEALDTLKNLANVWEIYLIFLTPSDEAEEHTRASLSLVPVPAHRILFCDTEVGVQACIRQLNARLHLECLPHLATVLKPILNQIIVITTDQCEGFLQLVQFPGCYMIDEYYTKFRFEEFDRTEHRVIGFAHFEDTRLHYPATAVVKVIWDKDAGQREIDLTLRCQTLHKNMVQLLCYYETSQAVVLFLEHCENLSLSEFFTESNAKGRILKEQEVLRMMQDVAEAVNAMHTSGFAHRDIKPHNVFVTKTNLCKLGDFEMVKEVRNDQSHLMSIPKGTPAYMSPSKAFQMERRDPSPALDRAFADDLWAMGKTFFELCIGRTDEIVCELTRNQPNQRQLQQYIQTSLRETKYSDVLASLIYRLLSSDPSFTSETVCSELENLQLDLFSPSKTLKGVDPKPLRCLTCRNSSNLTKLTCEHYQCNSCLSAYLSTRLSDPCTKSFSDIRCSACHKTIEYGTVVDNQRTYTEAVRRRLQRMEIMNATDVCSCQTPYYMLRKETGRLVPYLFRCGNCKETFCSWCKKTNGHKFLGIAKQCKSFKKLSKDFDFSCE